jgi:hypothetical protein
MDSVQVIQRAGDSVRVVRVNLSELVFPPLIRFQGDEHVWLILLYQFQELIGIAIRH